MEDLTFKVEPGRHLVICGHNGAGKSSIFRCLGGLWPFSKGMITCPSHGAGGSGLHGAAYYLPQRPANILGTLSDQLTYPTRVPGGGLPESDLRQWLSYVEVEYLVDAAALEGKLLEEADWAVKLSLGEQQRLGIARLLYHRPRFAILDECTSSMSKDMERWLFEVARELGISCVTITHRPALQEYHHQMLKLTGDLSEDAKGWELVDLPSNNLPMKTFAATEAEVHSRIQALKQKGRGQVRLPAEQSGGGSTSRSAASHQEARTTAHQAGAKEHKEADPVKSLNARVSERWPSVARRIAAALQVELMDSTTRRRFALLLAGIVIRPQAAWEVYRTVGGSVGLAMCNDSAGLWAELLINITYAAGLTFLDRGLENLARKVMIELWQNVVTSLHKDLLSGAAFQSVQAPGQHKIENPMQRIGEAKVLLDEVKGHLQSTCGQMVQMLYFLPLLLRGGGPMPAMMLVCLYITHSIVRKYWMPNFKAITATYSEFEDRFQVAQTRMRHVAEPVAFSGGGEAERLRVEEHFERLCAHRLSTMRQEFTYNFLTEFFLVYDNLPIWFHRVISFNFAWRNPPIGGASPASAVQNYLYDRTISVSLVGVQTLTAFPAELAKMDGRATRLLELREAIALAAQSQHQLPGTADGDRLAVKGLDLVTPRSVCLAQGLTFEVERGDPLLVTGPNGCGKTALARVLLGLWPSAGAGAVMAPPEGLMIVPQKPYLAPGSLGDQVTYPKRFEALPDTFKAEKALRAVGIGYVLERAAPFGGLGFHCAWEDTLSGGEQQRITLSRALFHQPAFCLLDECTSMVAADAEEQLYHAAIKDFGITPLTFSQRLFLSGLHSRELRLGDNSLAGWALEKTSERK